METYISFDIVVLEFKPEEVKFLIKTKSSSHPLKQNLNTHKTKFISIQAVCLYEA